MASCKWREWELWAERQGFKRIAGVDEAGRGPLAGPVVACICVLPDDHGIEGIKDSKALSPAERKRLYMCLTKHPEIDYGVGVVEADEIDRINILQATFAAMRQAIAQLKHKPDYIFVDGPLPIPQMKIAQKPLVDGDALCESIAAASIIAKYSRDELMVEYHKKYPLYGFDLHKGYATRAHLHALRRVGPCPLHRQSFEPVRNWDKPKHETEFDFFMNDILV